MRLPKKVRRPQRSDSAKVAGRKPSSPVVAPLAEFREVAAWPFAQKRLGPEYFTQVYGLEKCGVDYATKWLKEHGLTAHFEANELVHHLQVLDALLFHDGVDIVNSAGCEIIARRCIAIERTYTESPDFFALYDISKPSVRIPAADKTVMKQLAFDASMAKLLARQAAQDKGGAVM